MSVAVPQHRTLAIAIAVLALPIIVLCAALATVSIAWMFIALGIFVPLCSMVYMLGSGSPQPAGAAVVPPTRLRSLIAACVGLAVFVGVLYGVASAVGFFVSCLVLLALDPAWRYVYLIGIVGDG